MLDKVGHSGEAQVLQLQGSLMRHEESIVDQGVHELVITTESRSGLLVDIPDDVLFYLVGSHDAPSDVDRCILHQSRPRAVVLQAKDLCWHDNADLSDLDQNQGIHDVKVEALLA